MQISANENYAGYVLNVWNVNVRFNGEIIDNCVAADEEAGMAVVLKKVDGKFVHEDGNLVLEIVNGKVEIILPEGWFPILSGGRRGLLI